MRDETTPNSVRVIPRRRGAGSEAVAALDRDSRNPKLHGLSTDPIAPLRALEVAVVGLGSVGLIIADLLARLSIASLLLVDRGKLKPTSLLTHPIHPRDIGRPKATHAGERAKAVSPDTLVRVCDQPVETLPRDAFAGVSAVLLASDNHACELVVNQRCVHLGIHLIQAAVFPPTQSAQVRLFPNRDPEDACLACGYVDRDWEDLDRGTTYSCSGDGEVAEPSLVPTRAFPQHCSAAATLAVAELTRLVLGQAGDESHVVEHCAHDQTMLTTPLRRRDDCPVDHRRLRVVERPGRLAKATPRELMALVAPSPPTHLSLSVEGYRFASVGTCKCARHPGLGRFLPVAVEVVTCAGCGLPLVPHPLYTYDAVPGEALMSQIDRPIGEIGARAPSSVLVEGEEQGVLVTEVGR
jgi:molybdopterin/thiamine biosynthesis adenylyltransferase